MFLHISDPRTYIDRMTYQMFCIVLSLFLYLGTGFCSLPIISSMEIIHEGSLCASESLWTVKNSKMETDNSQISYLLLAHFNATQIPCSDPMWLP